MSAINSVPDSHRSSSVQDKEPVFFGGNKTNATTQDNSANSI